MHPDIDPTVAALQPALAALERRLDRLEHYAVCEVPSTVQRLADEMRAARLTGERPATHCNLSRFFNGDTHSDYLQPRYRRGGSPA